METKTHSYQRNNSKIPNNTFGHAGHPSEKLGRKAALFSAASAVLLVTQTLPAQPVFAPQVGAVFVIAMENHNFTQPNPTSTPQQIFGNPAAPFINSLVTPGNANAAHVSYATACYNAGIHVHPSEPNYVWAEAGTDFGVHTDADPRSANGNTFYDNSVHLTALLNAAGISWKNYQEDVELSVSPTNSASGTSASVINPYYGTGQFNYAVKHNPMAFFSDTAVQNVYPLAQLFDDLNNNAAGQYNWITPNQFNDAHSALSGGFTYQGTHYTGDQSSIAQGDNFLSKVIPQIMTSPAYQNNGVIVIWWDETESGDDTSHTIPEIVISPLAKGNAFASAVPLNHSSDIKTMEEIFGLPLLNNPIPVTETGVTGVGYNNVAIVNDLSDLFVSEAIPAPPSLSVRRSPLAFEGHSGHALQVAIITNTGNSPVPAPLWLVLDDLSPGATLLNSDGTSAVLAPLGSPYVNIDVGGDGILPPNETKIVLLEFLDPSGGAIEYTTRVLDVTPTP
jgi:hypothetical protein